MIFAVTPKAFFWVVVPSFEPFIESGALRYEEQGTSFKVVVTMTRIRFLKQSFKTEKERKFFKDNISSKGRILFLW